MSGQNLCSGTHVGVASEDNNGEICAKEEVKQRQRSDVEKSVRDIEGDHLPEPGKTELWDYEEKKKEKEEEEDCTQNSTPLPLQKRSSREKIDLLGLLSPAVPLFPYMNGTDSVSRQFEQLSDKDKNLILVAAHVDDALKGRGAYGKARAIFKPKWQRCCFTIIDNKWFTRTMYLFILLHSALVFFEPTQAHVKPGQVHWVVFVLELLCLFMYTIDISFHLHYFTCKTFWSRRVEETKWTRLEFVLLLMFVIDYVILILQHFITNVHFVQPFRCLRLSALLCKSKNVAHILDVCLSIVYKLGKVFFIIFVFIGMFSAVGVHIFSKSYHCLGTNISSAANNTSSNNSINCLEDYSNDYTGAFDNVGIAALRLFVLLTTENYPDLMVPAYNKQHANFIYFGTYLYVGVFCLTAILLAIVVESYWVVAKMHVKRERKREREELVKAWNILDPLGEGEIDVNDERIFTIFQMLRPKNSEEEIRELIEYVDHDQNNVIDVFNWTTKLTEALQIQFDQESDDFQLQEKTCALRMSRRVKQFIDSSIFSRTILILIVIHSILFCIKWYDMTDTDELIVQALRTCIISVFCVEIVLKLIGIGKQLRKPLEILDIILSVVGILANIQWYYLPYAFQDVDPETYRDAMVVVSCLAVFCRLGLNSRQTRKAVLIIMKIHPVMFDLIVMVVIIMFFYAVLGLEFFYGQTDTLDGSSGHYEYDCGLGFESLWNSMVCSLLHTFQLVTTSNWHEMMNTAMKSTNDWAALYFVSAYVLINLVVMNLFVAITIEAFNKLGAVEDIEEAETETDKSSETENKEKFSETAKKFFTSILASSRDDKEDPTVQVVSHGTGNGGRRMSIPALSRHSLSHTSLAGSNVRLSEALSPLPTHTQNQESDENEDSYAGLTATQIQERKMKKRMQNRRRQQNKIKVVRAFRKKDDSQLDLHVGDDVTILEKNGEFVKGTARGKTGWFPAHCVRELMKGAKRAKNRIAGATATVSPTDTTTSLSQDHGLSWVNASPGGDTMEHMENTQV